MNTLDYNTLNAGGDSVLTSADYQRALDSQGANNLPAVIQSMARSMPLVRGECTARSIFGLCVFQHPILVLYTTQIAWLTTRRMIDYHLYIAAYRYCEERVGRGRGWVNSFPAPRPNEETAAIAAFA